MLSQTIPSSTKPTIGDEVVTPEGMEKYYDIISAQWEFLQSPESGQGNALIQLVQDGSNFASILSDAERLQGFSHVVLVGVGGSITGTQALLPFQVSGPEVQCWDNPDAYTVQKRLAALPLQDTAFIFISKSGTTLETLSMALLICGHLEAEQVEVGKQCFIISDPQPSPLRTLAEHYGMKGFDHRPEIGGRFSFFTNVAMLPATLMGINIEAMRSGAAQVVSQPNPVFNAVAWHLSLFESGAAAQVVMPYCDRLYPYTLWYRQLWAESIGKEGLGTTPIAGLGTVDQHSQVQMYLDGYTDKYFTFITSGEKDSGRAIKPELAEKAGLSYLAGKTLGEVMQASAQATIETFQDQRRPIRRMELPTIDAYHLGSLCMFGILETLLVGHVLGINPYDQPAVEAAKKRARALLEV